MRDNLGHNVYHYTDEEIAKLRATARANPDISVAALLKRCNMTMGIHHAKKIINNKSRADANYTPTSGMRVESKKHSEASAAECARLRRVAAERLDLTIPEIVSEYGFNMSHCVAYHIYQNATHYDPNYKYVPRKRGMACKKHRAARPVAESRRFRCAVCGMGESVATGDHPFRSQEEADKCCERVALIMDERRPDLWEPPPALLKLLAAKPAEIAERGDQQDDEDYISHSLPL